MKQDDFFKAFVDVLEEASEMEVKEELSDYTKFKELEGWGSLTAVMTIVMVEEQFGKQITTDDFEACDTLGALYQLIETK